MDLSRPLEVVTPTADGEVLRVLALADHAFTPGEVKHLLGGYSVSGVRKVLLRLSTQGIVRQERAGTGYVYRLNRDHLGASAVIALATLKEQLLERLRDEFAGWEPQPSYAAMFGSAARGDMRTDSDIDLFVVRPDRVTAESQHWREQLVQLTERVTAWTGNDTRVLEMTETEAKAGAAAGEPVLRDIARDGLRLCGDSRMLRKVPTSA